MAWKGVLSGLPRGWRGSFPGPPKERTSPALLPPSAAADSSGSRIFSSATLTRDVPPPPFFLRTTPRRFERVNFEKDLVKARVAALGQPEKDDISVSQRWMQRQTVGANPAGGKEAGQWGRQGRTGEARRRGWVMPRPAQFFPRSMEAMTSPSRIGSSSSFNRLHRVLLPRPPLKHRRAPAASVVVVNRLLGGNSEGGNSDPHWTSRATRQRT